MEAATTNWPDNEGSTQLSGFTKGKSIKETGKKCPLHQVTRIRYSFNNWKANESLIFHLTRPLIDLCLNSLTSYIIFNYSINVYK